jgi:hypothetical protein
MLSIPVADALGFLLAGWQARRAGIVLVVGALSVQLLVQEVVLSHQVREKIAFFGAFPAIAADLHRLGVRPPCLVRGRQEIPVAFYAGCASTPSAVVVRQAHPQVRIAVLVPTGQPPPSYARSWPRHVLRGIRSPSLRFDAYVAPLGR